MTIQNPPFEDVFGDFPICHVSFQGCNSGVLPRYWMMKCFFLFCGRNFTCVTRQSHQLPRPFKRLLKTTRSLGVGKVLMDFLAKVVDAQTQAEIDELQAEV